MATYSDAISSYIRQTFAREDEVLAHIRQAIPERGLPAITVQPEEGRFLQFLATVCDSHLALEIGTLGGYSGVWIARGLASGGRLITIEKIPARATVAREHFQLAGVAERVEVRVGNAHDLLPGLGSEGPFDFIFIDAEKQGYPAYLDWAVVNLRPGGVLAAHNAFRHGAVVDPSHHDPATKAIRNFNRRLADHPHVVSAVFPAGDGIAIAVFRGEPRDKC